MSQLQISLSPDLKRLQDEGYEVDVRLGFLLIGHIPYVDTQRQIGYGVLVSKLTLAGDVATKPEDHVVMFSGATPCDSDGRPLQQIINSSQRQVLAEDITVDHTFSSKPSAGYPDYYAKMTAYVNILLSQAHSLDPSVTPRTYPVIQEQNDESVFEYIDTASSRAEIGVVTAKLELGRVAIIGLGGTGSYILDFVAKTPVREIHLFDGDRILQHNAFRSPGAPSVEELRQREPKVAFYAARYSKMHRHIKPHPYYVDASNVDQLRDMTFVFLSLDKGAAKRSIVTKLDEFGTPFVDVGMGIYEAHGSLGGLVRVTTSTPSMRRHVRGRIPFSDGDANNDYSRNIQIADLNALNAALAVIKWKKLLGFYHDFEHEHFSAYAIDGNHILNEDRV